MEQLTEKLLDTKLVFTGKFLRVRYDQVLLPDGKKATREVVEHPGAVAIVPLLPDFRVVFVKQYRYAVNDLLLEIPAGKLECGEEPTNCALRELKEETGFSAANIKKIAGFYTTPGFSNEFLHLFLANDLFFTEQHLDEDEFISIESYCPEQIQQLVKNGRICDAKTLLGLSLAGII